MNKEKKRSRRGMLIIPNRFPMTIEPKNYPMTIEPKNYPMTLGEDYPMELQDE